MPIKILGLSFVGTRTSHQAEMATFVHEVLGLQPVEVSGADASFFDLPDGSSFAVSPTEPGEDPERTVGFLVEDLDSAVAELRAAGVQTDEVAETNRQRYVHFRGPDGRLYELVQEIG